MSSVSAAPGDAVPPAEEAKQPSLEGQRDNHWRLPGWFKWSLKPQVELAQARLLVELGKDAEAEQALDRAERGDVTQKEEVEILHARIELHPLSR